MIEFGHYQELAWILERINGAKGVESGAESEGRNWQTFVFSATLTLPRRSAEKKRKDRRRKNLSGQESVGKNVCPCSSSQNSLSPSPPSLPLSLSLPSLPPSLLPPSLPLSPPLPLPPSLLSPSSLPPLPPSLPPSSLSLSPPSPSLLPSLSRSLTDNLISMVGLRDNPAVVDVTTQSGTVETLSEMKIMCSAEEKVRDLRSINVPSYSLCSSLYLPLPPSPYTIYHFLPPSPLSPLFFSSPSHALCILYLPFSLPPLSFPPLSSKDAYLYYFLLLYSGQTLVFVNSISTLHKLHSLLSLLHLRPLLLHAHMQQRQRLKNFDR